MGVGTTAILRRGVTIEQIEKVLSEKYTDVEVRTNSMVHFMYLTFKDGEDQRQIAVSFSNSCERDNGISGVWCSLGMWGNSVEIARYLCETFGGYLDENDCDGEGFYPINYHLYSQGTEFTKLDELRHEIISKIGFDKVNTVLELFKKYKKCQHQH